MSTLAGWVRDPDADLRVSLVALIVVEQVGGNSLLLSASPCRPPARSCTSSRTAVRPAADHRPWYAGWRRCSAGPACSPSAAPCLTWSRRRRPLRRPAERRPGGRRRPRRPRRRRPGLAGTDRPRAHHDRRAQPPAAADDRGELAHRPWRRRPCRQRGAARSRWSRSTGRCGRRATASADGAPKPLVSDPPTRCDTPSVAWPWLIIRCSRRSRRPCGRGSPRRFPSRPRPRSQGWPPIIGGRAHADLRPTGSGKTLDRVPVVDRPSRHHARRPTTAAAAPGCCTSRRCGPWPSTSRRTSGPR